MSYDAAGRVAGLSTTALGGAAQSVVSNVSYHPFGRPKGWSFGNGQTHARTFDLDGRLASFTLGSATKTVGFSMPPRASSPSPTALRARR